jgi:beta-lactamase superfamily II metal-dependent hydrolase
MKSALRTSFALVFLLAACGDGGLEPRPAPPEIAVTGVADGERYQAAVTIGVTVDRGSFTATLNGEQVHPPFVVDRPGDYVLTVTATSGTVSSTRSVGFVLEVAGESILIVRLLDLGDGLGGGGDAILISDSSAAGQRAAVIDAGPRGAGGNVTSYAFVAQRLLAHQVTELELLQLTHAHADHFAGMPDILEDTRIRVRRFLYNGQVRSMPAYQQVLAAAAAHADTVVAVRTGVRAYTLGTGAHATRLEVIPPLPTYLDLDTGDGALLNEGSLGTRLTRGTFSMFFTGDGEYEANHRWRTDFADHTRNLTVLKVGHHGANNAIFDAGTSGPSTWLTHTAPGIAVISANGRTHPRQRALGRLHQQRSREVYCTSVHGTIEIRVAPSGLHDVRVARNADADCVEGSEATS